ncbi:MAG: glycosyltransferase family 4 protein [Deltaproteobacteria bacterium]|nr:glycosyltransferase family 4 protein [Deltaproteobacteria bacterium]
MKSGKKKIAIVVPKYGLMGGGERFVCELTEHLAREPRYDIHVLANKWRARSNRVKFHYLPLIRFPRWLTTVSFAYFAARKIRSMKFDVVHAHDRILEADICSMHFIPHRIWVREVRRKKLLSLFDRATVWVERKMFSAPRACKYVLPVSSLAAEKFEVEYYAREHEVQVVHPGVDPEVFSRGDEGDRNRVRAEFKVSQNDLLILFAGMNFELKGLDRLLGAMAGSRNESHHRDLKLLVVGKGNIKKYRAIVSSLGLTEQVFFAGVRHDLPTIYRAADIFALLSEFDTFGMVVTEAMASGLPVVISDRVGAKDLVKDAENGFIVDGANLGEISARIKILASDGNKRKEMGQKARETAAQTTWEAAARKVLEAYRRVTGEEM